ncbi:MAG: TonB-dependent receptor [Saprospiraceae bacterium]|nr:TonB-dependent receptor [Saprospiraceae bacterium]
MKVICCSLFFLISCFACKNTVYAQVTLKGKVSDQRNGEALIGASVVLQTNTDIGTTTDYDGTFELKVNSLPTNLLVSYIGYTELVYEVTTASDKINIKLFEDAITIDLGVEIKGQRIDTKQKESPLTVESLDAIAIKQTASNDFYSGLGALKGVDLTTASIGFTIINTRGFNSTSPVRSLQIIDGVDNQSPGLNFSLGNFLGSPELDIQKVDLVVGASSAFYGPNAFNGVISMETKNPFYNKGLSVSVKAGERELFETAFRYADVIKNKNGHDFLAFKANLFFMKAYDWVADNYDPVSGSRSAADNPGRFDKVNSYGDEYKVIFDESRTALFRPQAGMGIYHRRGYDEIDIVDYNTKNFKSNIGLHLRLFPSMKEESPELIYGFNIGNGTTVYQGDNRFSLKNITFYQNKIEFKKRNKYFIRAYNTQEDAGDSYDPYFTALLMQQRAKDDVNWYSDYLFHWESNATPDMRENGYPQLTFDPNTFTFNFDSLQAKSWLVSNRDKLVEYHDNALNYANTHTVAGKTFEFYEPGTDRFNQLFKEITTKKSNKRDINSGTRFFDKSALYHVHGEYKFEPSFTDAIVVGANGRLYTPNSEGTIFYDTADVKITNHEFGMYTGIEKKFSDNKFKFNATIRADKNVNFDWLFSPAASLVYTPSNNNYFRLSFSSAIRNPTLTDQYLFLNVGPAILSGNLEGKQNLITVESFIDYLNTFDKNRLSYYNIEGVRPEKVKSIELGYRTTLFNNTFVDASYYYSRYDDFLGFVIGVDSEFDEVVGLPRNTQVYRYAANSFNTVTTQGFSLGLNYYFQKYYMLAGNYSWNTLNKLDVDDPIIPAFNTPEHKYNVSISGRDIVIKMGGTKIQNLGFNVNYRWVASFIFEGSPQFTGVIPAYGLIDAQVNYGIPKIKLTIKTGASNILNNKVFQTYGGPRIGRMAYISLLYDFKKN